MKQYKKVELVAKNQIAGSYAAGCPSQDRDCQVFLRVGVHCAKCDRAS